MRQRRTVIFVLLLVFGLPIPAVAAPSNSEEPSEFQIIRTRPLVPAYLLKEHHATITKVLIRNNSGTSWCFMLSPGGPPRLGAHYKIAPPALARQDGANQASWIARFAESTGNPLKPYDSKELVAKQLAIWSITAGWSITNKTVPNAELRRRAEELSRAAMIRAAIMATSSDPVST
jgi:hypothetical protein